MKPCLFCQSLGPYSTIEHIIPESLGNDDLLLKGEVCDSCQNYFGQEVEHFVLNKTPIAFWKTWLGIKSKKRRVPPINLSQPKKQKGVFPVVHPKHDNIGFAYHEDGSISVDIEDSDLVSSILKGDRNQFQFVFTPKVLHMLGRFLCKVGLELLCLTDSNQARQDSLSVARRYARFGEFKELYPIFHFSKGALQDFRRLEYDGEGLLEEVDCFSYSLLNFQSQYLLFYFGMGTDNWVICLNDPYPNPIIRNAFPSEMLNLIWYSREEWQQPNTSRQRTDESR